MSTLKDIGTALFAVVILFAMVVSVASAIGLFIDYIQRCGSMNSECDLNKFSYAHGFACCPKDAKWKACR